MLFFLCVNKLNFYCDKINSSTIVSLVKRRQLNGKFTNREKLWEQLKVRKSFN